MTAANPGTGTTPHGASWFQRFLLPGFAFKAVVIGGGYATGRELAEFFLGSGPQGGLMGMVLAMLFAGYGIACVAGVSLGLLHGSQPDIIIVCHEPGRDRVLGLPDFAVPSIEETIATNLMLGRRTNPTIRCGGVSLNTAALGESAAQDEIARVADRLGLPVADPLRGGAALDRLIDHSIA